MDNGGSSHNWRLLQRTLRRARLTFFDYLLENDPRVASLRADFGDLSVDKRCRAVDKILSATTAEGSPGDHGQQPHFATLLHPGIEAQLDCWLFDASKPLVTRDLAFDIGLACCGPNFWEKFWVIASAKRDEFITSRLPLRNNAFGPKWPQKRLLELALPTQTNDSLVLLYTPC